MVTASLCLWEVFYSMQKARSVFSQIGDSLELESSGYTQWSIIIITGIAHKGSIMYCTSFLYTTAIGISQVSCQYVKKVEPFQNLALTSLNVFTAYPWNTDCCYGISCRKSYLPYTTHTFFSSNFKHVFIHFNEQGGENWTQGSCEHIMKLYITMIQTLISFKYLSKQKGILCSR